MIGGRRAVVVAFDGLIADTLGLRASAVAAALLAEGVECSRELAMQQVAGRTLHECIRYLVSSRTDVVDETTIDLATLRALRACEREMQGTIVLQPHAVSWVQRAAMHLRIVVRADSNRRDVERLLDAAGIAPFVTFLRCADDSPAASSPMCAAAYQAIAVRLEASGIVAADVRGLECASQGPCGSAAGIQVRRVTSVTEAAADVLHLF